MERQELIKKIEQLSPEQLSQVESLVESLAGDTSDSENLHRALLEYATRHAGTPADLDFDLESASLEHLLQETSD